MRTWMAFVGIVVLAQASLPVWGQEATVSNVSFTQGPNGALGTRVDIYYDLASPGGNCTILATLSKDGGASFPFAIVSATGDVGPNVSPGVGKHIVWSVSADCPDQLVGAAAIQVTASLPDTGGPYALGYTDVTYTDLARSSRSIPARIWYPAASAGADVPVAGGAGVKFPLVVFGHGMTSTINSYDYLWNSFVPSGYIWVMCDTVPGIVGAAETADFARDLVFLVNQLQSEGANAASRFYQKVALPTALMGHSMGGGASVYAAGLLNSSGIITTIVPLAGADMGLLLASAAAPYITIPTLFVSGSLDCIAPVSMQVPMFDAIPPGCKYILSVTGGSHCQFGQSQTGCTTLEFVDGCASPAIDRGTQFALVLGAAKPWLDLKLKGLDSGGVQFNQYRVANLGTGAITEPRSGGCSFATHAASSVGTLETVRPTVNSVAVLTRQSIQVSFREAMRGPGITTPANYVLSGAGIGNLTAAPASVSGSGPYLLTWPSGEMLNGGLVTMTVTGVQDIVGNVITTPNSRDGTGIGTFPTGTVTINGGAEYTTSTLVSLTLSATDMESGVASMQFSNDGSNWIDWEAYATSKSWTLFTGDWPKTVYVQFKDGAGNVSTAGITDTITLDTTPPTGTVSINGGAAYCNTPAVTLTLTSNDSTGSGVAQMQFLNKGLHWSDWENIDTSKTWTLSSGDGVKTVYIHFKDAMGNVSTDTITDTIALDTGPPTGTVSIDNGAAYCDTTNVTLTLSASDGSGSGVAQMQFSNDGSTWSTAEPYAITKSWDLDLGADGSRTVYVKYSDAIGNWSGDISSVILLDTSAPTGMISINNGVAVTSSADVTLVLSASDGSGSGVAQMQFSNDNSTWSPPEAYATTTSWTLASGADGLRTVWVKYRDELGTWSSGFSDTISLDTSLPQGTIAINGGATCTRVRDVTLTLSAATPSGTITQMQFSDDNTTWTTEEAYATTKAWTLPSGADGLRTVYVRYENSLNAWSPSIPDEIILDTVPPTGAVSVNGEAAYANNLSVTLTLTSDDTTSGVADMQFSNDNATWSGWEAVTGTKAWNLASGDGLKTVYVQYRDVAGNVSTATIGDDITLDTEAPTASIALDDPTTTGADAVHFSVDFREPLMIPLTASDVSLTPGSLAGSIAVGNTDPDYTVTVTLSDPNADGTLGITIPAGVVSDLAGNPYGGGTSPPYTIRNVTLPIAGLVGLAALLGLIAVTGAGRTRKK